jgi:hypothetical protein
MLKSRSQETEEESAGPRQKKIQVGRGFSLDKDMTAIPAASSGLKPTLVQIRNQLNITISVFLRLLQQVGAGFSPHNVTGISCRAFARAEARAHLFSFFLADGISGYRVDCSFSRRRGSGLSGYFPPAEPGN